MRDVPNPEGPARTRRTRLAALGVLAAVVGIAAPVGAQSDAAPRGPRIAFVSDREGGNDVYLMDLDGGDVDRLTEGADASGPAFSPDGSLVAFTSEIDGADIHVVQTDGLGLRAVTTDGADNRNPAFSPDGSTIVFQAEHDGNTDIYAMDLFGQDVRRLTTDPADDITPTFSPDGATIAFSSTRAGDHDIWVMAADGSGQTRVTDDPTLEFGPAFSPEGTAIAFAAQEPAGESIHLVAADLDGTARRVLVPGARVDLAPAFAPDGTIVFQASDNGDDSGGFSLARIGIDGTGLRVLTDTAADELDPSIAVSDLEVDPELAVVEEVRAARDAVNAHTDEAVAGVNGRLDDLAGRIGTNTRSVCVDGSVRRDGNRGFQTFLNLLSPTAQTVQVRFLTNKGTHVQQVPLQADRRTTLDVNQVLLGPGGPFAGQSDVDVAIEVTGTEAVFIGCPVFFDANAGAAGRVSGAFDQHVHTN